MHDGDVVPDRRVVEQVTGREVVGAVDDRVPAVAEDPVDVLGGEPLGVGGDADVRVERLDRPLRRLGLRVAQALGRVHDLALEIRLVDSIVVHDSERADARGCEVEGRGRAQPSGADQEDPRLEQPELSLLADLEDQQMAAVAAPLLLAGDFGSSVGSRSLPSVQPPSRLATSA